MSLDTHPTSTISILLARLFFIVWSLVVILAINTVIPFEWTHPYCNDQTDGPAWAAFGFPLPYREFSGVSSMTDNIMPHILLLNILLLAVLASLFMEWAVRRLSAAGMLVGVSTVPGVLLLVLCAMIISFGFRSGFVVTSITNHGSYWEYRPIGVRLSGYQACTPSEFWFGPIKYHQ
jgi:hypothetical protein